MMKTALQLSSEEQKMMKEMSTIFSKYKGKTRQFGLQLIHAHFPIQHDEILYETHDKELRTLTTTLVKKSKAGNAVATAWNISERGEISVTSLCCDVPDWPDDDED